MTRSLLIAGILFCLIACSSNQQKDAETALAAASTLALQSLQQTLPGLYGNYAQHWASSQDTGETSPSEHWRLNINALRSASGEAWFSLHQYPGSDASQGNTSLLQFSFAADQLVLRFSPYTDSNAPRDLNADQLELHHASPLIFLENHLLELGYPDQFDQTLRDFRFHP